MGCQLKQDLSEMDRMPCWWQLTIPPAQVWLVKPLSSFSQEPLSSFLYIHMWPSKRFHYRRQYLQKNICPRNCITNVINWTILQITKTLTLKGYWTTFLQQDKFQHEWSCPIKSSRQNNHQLHSVLNTRKEKNRQKKPYGLTPVHTVQNNDGAQPHHKTFLYGYSGSHRHRSFCQHNGSVSI